MALSRIFNVLLILSVFLVVGLFQAQRLQPETQHGQIQQEDAGLEQEAILLREPVRSVGFMEGSSLDAAAISSEGAEGVTRLGEVFQELGATVSLISPDQPIPDHIELVVIIRPRRPFSTQLTAYLWDFLLDGGHLLLALDPNGHNRVNTENARSGLNRLLDAEYGISIVDNTLVEPWFGLEPLSDIVTSWSEIYAENIVTHPITQPLISYDLPLRYWGGRSVLVEAVNGYANTTALLYTENPYGEHQRINFNSEDGDQLQLNIGTDSQGRLLLGGIAENIDTGSRIALIGDGEIFENIFGFTRIAENDNRPRFPGNAIFAQRVAAWLMGLPEETWPGLPDGYTWIALDGDGSEWPTDVPEYVDPAFEIESLDVDIQRVRLFHNDQFLYINLDTVAGMSERVRVNLELLIGTETFLIRLENGMVTALFPGAGSLRLEDAAYAISQGLEIRLPLRIVGDSPILSQICLVRPGTDVSDCLDEKMASRSVPTIDPVPLRFGIAPSVFTSEAANIRTGPGLNNTLITQLPARTNLMIDGRNEAGDWMHVRNGHYVGWIADFLLVRNISLDQLPVIE